MEDCSLERLQAIHLKVVEASPDAKIVIDETGRIIVFNQRAEFMFGYDRSEVLGKPIEKLLPPEKATQHENHRNGFFADPRTREMGTGQILEGQHRNGQVFRIQIKLAPLMVPNFGVHVLAVVRRVVTPTEVSSDH